MRVYVRLRERAHNRGEVDGCSGGVCFEAGEPEEVVDEAAQSFALACYFAPGAYSTDETASTWIALGTLTLVAGLLLLVFAVRLLRRP